MPKSYEIIDGIPYEVTRDPCVNFDFVMKSIVLDKFVHIGEITKGIHTGINSRGQFVHAKKMDTLIIDMRFKIKYNRTSKGLDVCHVPSPSCGEFIKAEWTVPSYMEIYFVNSGSSYHLLCYIQEDDTFRKLPFPNVYDSGKLCTGDLPIRNHQAEADYFKEVTDAWSRNQWNGDLYGHYDDGKYIWKIDQLEHLVRFDEKMNQLPSTLDFIDMQICHPECDTSIIESTRSASCA